MSRQSGMVSTYFCRMVRDRKGEPVEAEYRVVADFSPGHPGKLYGPPENCYPPEEAEVEYAEVFEVEGKTEKRLNLMEFLDSLTKEQDSELQARLIMEGEEHGTDLENEAAERKYDEMRDRQGE